MSVDWEMYERAMKPLREKAKQPPKPNKKEKPDGGRPTKLFFKLIGS